MAYVRIDKEPISTRSKIYTPDVVIVMDDSLFKVMDPLQGIKPDGMTIINYPDSHEAPLPQLVKTAGQSFMVDATRLAHKIYGRTTIPITNVIITGAYCAAKKTVSLEAVKHVLPEVDDTFGQTFDRRYGGLLSAEMMEGAEVAVLTLGSLASTARSVVSYLRKEKGLPVGLIKLRTVRPFPDKTLKECLSGLKAVAVLERDLTFDDVLSIAMTLYEEREGETVENPIRWWDVRGLS